MAAEIAHNPQANALGEFMSFLSEACYSAGWLTGTEWILWRALTDWRAGKRAYWSPGSQFPDDITDYMPALDALQRAVGGWVWWLDGMTFVPEERWLRLVAALDVSSRSYWDCDNRELDRQVDR